MTPTKPPTPSRSDEARKRGAETVIHARKQAQRLAVGMAVVSVGVCAFTVWSVTHRRAAPTVAIHTEDTRPRHRAPAPESAPPVATPSASAVAPSARVATAAPVAPAATPPSAVAPVAPSPSTSVVAAAPDASGLRLTLTSATVRVDTPPSGNAQGGPESPAASATAAAASPTAPPPDTSATERGVNAAGDTAPAIATVLGAVELELARAEARGDDALAGRLEQQRTDLLKRLRDAVRASGNTAAPAPGTAAAPP